MADPLDLKVLITVGQESKAALAELSNTVRGTAASLQQLAQVKFDDITRQLDKFHASAGTAGDKVDEVHKKVDRFSEATGGMSKDVAEVSETLSRFREALDFVLGGFLALESVRFLKELADTSAKTEQFGSVLYVVGSNAGYTREQLDDTTDSMEAMGLTAEGSRRSLTKLIQSQLDLSYATKLTAAAQNASAASGESVDASLNNIIQSIESRSVRQLRSLGFLVDITEAENAYARSIGTSASALTQREERAAIANAVVQENIRVEGAYAESLTTVGTQLINLKANQEGLSDSVGKVLLPAYFAFITQLNLTLQELTAVSDKEREAGDAGVSFGEHLNSLLNVIREVVVFLAKHYEVTGLVTLALTLLAAKVIIVTFLETSMGAAFLNTAELVIANSLALFANGAAILKTIGYLFEYAAANGVAEAAALGFNASVHVLSGTLLANPLTALILAFSTLLLWVYKVVDAQKSLVAGATWATVWRSQIDELKTTMSDILAISEALLGSFTSLSKLKNPFNWRKDIETARNEEESEAKAALTPALATGRYLAALEDSNKKIDAYEKGQATHWKNKTAEEAAAIEKAYKDSLPLVVKAKEDRDRALAQGVPTDIREREEARAKTKETENAARNLSIDASNAREKILGGDAVVGGLVQTDAFQAKLRAFNTDLEEFTKKGKDSKISVDDLRESLKRLALTVTQPGDLKGFNERLAFLSTNPDTKGIASNAGADRARATLDTRNQVLSFNEPARQEELGRLKNVNDAAIQVEQDALDRLKEVHAKAELEDKGLQDEGLLSLNQYYSRRRNVLQTESDQEVKILEKQREGLRQRLALATTPNEAGTLRNQIDKQTEAITNERSRTAQSISSLELENTQKNIDLQRQIKGIQDDTLKYYGGLPGALAEIHARYLQLRQDTGALAEGNEDVLRTLNAAEDKDVFAANLENENRLLQVQEGLAASISDIRKSQIEAQFTLGSLTDVQKQDALNLVSLQEQKDVLVQLAGAQKYLNELQSARTKDLQDHADDPSYQSTGLDQQLDEQQTKINKLTASYYQLAASIKTVGEQLQKSLTEGISTALDQIISRTKSAGDAIKDLINGFVQQIIHLETQKLAQQFVQNLVTRTSAKDADGKAVQGTSVFDKIASSLNLGDNSKFGETVNKPIFAHITNTRDITGPIAGAADGTNVRQGTQSIPSTVTVPGQQRASGPSDSGGGGSTSIPAQATSAAGSGGSSNAFEPVLGASLGESGGDFIGDLIAKSSTWKYSPGRPIAELQDKAKGRAIGGLGGAILGIINANRGGRGGPDLSGLGASNLSALEDYAGNSADFAAEGSDDLADLIGYADGGEVDSNGIPKQWNQLLNEIKPIWQGSGGSWEGLINAFGKWGLNSALGKWGARPGVEGTGNTSSDPTSLLGGWTAGDAEFGDGGQLPGFGGGDVVPAMLTPGEFIMNKDSTAKYLPMLHAMNNGDNSFLQSIAMSGVSKFAAGGVAGGGAPTLPSIGGSSPGNGVMQVMLHPDALGMSMNDWLQKTVASQYANR